MIAYVETSAFVKLVIDEVGSGDAQYAWASADRRVSSRLLYAEARSALASAVRGRRVRQSEEPKARASLEMLWRAIDPVEVDGDLVAAAGDLAEQHALRGFDAVHLASLLTVADEETVLVSADGELLEAAQARGLATFSVAA